MKELDSPGFTGAYPAGPDGELMREKRRREEIKRIELCL